MSNYEEINNAMKKGIEYTNVPDGKKFNPTQIITFGCESGKAYVYTYDIETKVQTKKPLFE